jgi:predicted  nucleic acid-binding Zn-ribbon protein
VTIASGTISDLLKKNEQLERERDEARKKLDEEMKWHHRTHKELVEAQCKLLDMEYDQLKS